MSIQMAYKSDHDFRTGLFRQVTRGMDKDQDREFHDYLHDNYWEEKDSMTYQMLLDAAKAFMSRNYPDYSWNNQKWI
ncbi:hypothetical protein [Microcoleus sp. D2_18a_B4]|uniref:hypothetical protein n=1 Tax=Microcoleus sp. D2_18a_B4 TaxID=3055329 RepID=UPI002FCFD49A